MERKIATLAIILVMSLLLMGTLTLASDIQPVKREGTIYSASEDFVAQSSVDWWPMFHHDLRHTGYSTSTAPNTNETIWTYTTGGIETSSPAVVDGKVYVGSRDNKVYCLDALTGAHIWNYTTGDEVDSSPAVADGKVYVGSDDGKVYCLDALTGAHIWNYTTGDIVRSSPAVADGKVYVGSWDGRVFCLNALTGALVWKSSMGIFVWYSSPAVADGKVYLGAVDGMAVDGRVFCLDAATGAHIWDCTIGDEVDSSPAVADGKVYVGSDDGKVYCLDALTGAHIWNYTTGDPPWDYVYSSPAVAYGRVFVGSADGKVYCLDALTGAHIWDYTTTGPQGEQSLIAMSSPAVADGKVYVGSFLLKVYCLDALTGAHIWDYTTGGGMQSSPAVADGKVYVGSEDGKVYAFGPAHTLTITTTTGGTTSPSPGTHTYSKGISVSVTATPDPNYVFNHWELDGSWDYSNPVSVTMDSDHTLHAVFTYDVTIKAHCLTEGEDVSVSVDGYTTPHTFTGLTGTHTFTVPSTDPHGHPFKQWSTGETSTTITVTTGGTYTAYYQAKYTLTITTTTGGTTNPSPGTHTYWDGTSVSVTAIPNTGSYFDHWELDDSWDYSNPIDVMMDSDHTLHAVFTYDVTIKAHCHTEGVDVSVSIDIDGSPTDYKTPHTFTGLTGTHTFTVPDTDPHGHPFKQWSTGETSTTITVTTGGTYTAYYEIDIHDVAVTDVTPSKTVVCQGYSMSINVTVENQGNCAETFNVTAYSNETEIDTEEITLMSGSSTTITFYWNTTGFQEYKNYTISAYAHPVPGEIATADNTFIDDLVLVVHVGDVNCDRKVRVDDILIIAMAFGTEPGHPRWDPNADINGDGKIRVDDILAAVLQFGWG